MNINKIKLYTYLLLIALLSACTEAPTATTPLPPTATPAPEIVFVGHRPGIRVETESEIVKQFVAETGIQVDMRPGHESVTDRIAYYQELFATDSDEVDVYMIDVIWPGMLAEHMLDLTPYLSETAQAHFSAIVKNNTIDDKLVAMPMYTDAGLLYYRKDLLQRYGYNAPPTTWTELTDMAATIQAGERDEGNLDFWGFVWTGAAYEGLTCNAFEWQVSMGGGHIIEPDGTISINNPQTVQAFQQATDWIDTISPPGTPGFKGEDARTIWQAGNAAFMRSWPYAYSLGQAEDSLIKDRFGVTLLPTGGTQHADVLGGYQLAVSKNTKHPEAVATFIEYLVSYEVQKKRAIEVSLLPTIPELYDDPDVLAANPYYADLKSVFFGGAVARPSTVTGELYNDVSTAYFQTVNQILKREISAEAGVAALETTLVEITGFETGPPYE